MDNKNPEKEKTKIEPIVKAGAKKKKQSLSRKLSETFIMEDAANVKNYILFDVVLPAVKDLIADAGKSFIDSMLYGDSGRGRSRTGTNSRTSYTRYYEDRGTTFRRGSSNSQKEDRHSERYTYEDVIFENKGVAELVLDKMIDYIDQYDFVTVSDFYQFCDLPDEHTDRNWGWDNLSMARTERVQGGYIIKFPRIKPA